MDPMKDPRSDTTEKEGLVVGFVIPRDAQRSTNKVAWDEEKLMH